MSRTLLRCVCVFLMVGALSVGHAQDSQSQPSANSQSRPSPSSPPPQQQASGNTPSPPQQQSAYTSPSSQQQSASAPPPSSPHSANNDSSIPKTPAGQIWNLKDADINAVINTVSVITGKTFIVDPSVKGNVSLVSQHPMNNDEMYQAFLSMLEALNYVAIPTSAGIKITPAQTANGIPASSASSDKVGGSTPIVQVIPLQHMSAIQLTSSLKKMVPSWGSVNAYTPTNSLIVTGTASSVKQIVAVVKKMESNSTKKVEVVKLEYASAKNTNDVLKSFLQSGLSHGQTTTLAYASDDQTNSILLSGNIHEVEQAKQLLKSVDKPEAMEGSMVVIPLRYINAVDIQPVLANIASGSSELVTGDMPTTSDFVSTSSGTDDSSSTSSSGSGVYGNTSSTSSGSSATAIRSSGSSQGMSSSGSQSFSDTVSIQAITATNSIAIHAPKALMTALTGVLKKLDKRPHQILVQAVIAKVDQTVLNQLGVQWSLLDGDSSSASPVNGDDSNGLYNFVASGGEMGLMSGTNIQALVSAITNNSTTDLLSTPSIMVLDNQIASISDGANIGVESGSYDGGIDGSSTTTTRMNVDLSLQVIPHVIEENNMIKMAIKQADDSINEDGTAYTTTETNPELDTSEIDTTVMVKSGDILVLGGLINNDNRYKKEKVPVLGNIPILGSLFTYNYKKKEKKNLVVFLRPIAIKSNAKAVNLSVDKLDFLNQDMGSDNSLLLKEALGDKAKLIHLPPPRSTTSSQAHG